MIISSNTFKTEEKNGFSLFIFIFLNEVQAIAQNNSTKEIEAFDKVGKIEDLGVLPYTFSDVQIIIANNQFTIVPNALFDTENIESLLSFSIENAEQLETRHDSIPKFDIQIIWGIDKYLKDKIVSYWPGASFQHLISKKLNSVNENQSQNSLFIDVIPKGILTILFVENNLQFANYYPSESVTNTLYYSLVGLERTNTPPKNILAFINGDTKTKETIGKYFLNVSNEKFSSNCSLPIPDQDKSIFLLL